MVNYKIHDYWLNIWNTILTPYNRLCMKHIYPYTIMHVRMLYEYECMIIQTYQEKNKYDKNEYASKKSTYIMLLFIIVATNDIIKILMKATENDIKENVRRGTAIFSEHTPVRSVMQTIRKQLSDLHVSKWVIMKGCVCFQRIPLVWCH